MAKWDETTFGMSNIGLQLRQNKVIYAFPGGAYDATISAFHLRTFNPRVGHLFMERHLAFAVKKGRREFDKKRNLYWYWMHAWVVAIGEDGTVVVGFGRTYKLALNSLEVVVP